MQFQVEQRFAATRDAVMAVYTDPAFYPRLDGLAKIGRPEVVGREDSGDRVTMRVRYFFTADLPPGGSKILDPDKLSWIEETVYDLTKGTGATKLLPDNYPDRLTASARAQFLADPADPSKSIRRIQGDIKVRVPLVAGRVERAIVEGFEEHLANEEKIVREFLES